MTAQEAAEAGAAVTHVTAALPAAGRPKMTKIVIITSQLRFEILKEALDKLGITGMTVTHVMGCGVQKGQPEYYRGALVETSLLPKIQVDIVVAKGSCITGYSNRQKGALHRSHRRRQDICLRC